MIDVICKCTRPKKLAESAIGKRARCPGCSLIVQPICAEQLAPDGGAGDFDSGLDIIAGPDLVGDRLLLGGVADIQIGKLADRQLVLPGIRVSRAHCKLVRVDFGPSRWKIVDNRSTNGLMVNGQRVAEQELQNGDVITIGEYQLQFGHFEPIAPPVAAAPVLSPAHAQPMAGGPVCPSCKKSLARNAKICVGCGINIESGRPILTSQGVDLNSLYESAYQWIRWISWVVWVTPMPMPIRSEAFGTRKPYAIWTIAIATTLASVLFFLAQNLGGEAGDRPGKELMLWSPHATAGMLQIDPGKIHRMAQRLTPEQRTELRQEFDPRGELSDDALIARVAASVLGSSGEFHWYQLITHAFLHDTSSVYNFLMHLLGNMVFLLVFGTRVNALIGNLATAILYPILAVCAASAHLLSLGDSPAGPMLGASGAIMGLAGMYLILFPVHRVICAMWISIWLRFRRFFACKIFPLRGFWVLLIYFGYDLLMSFISSHFGIGGGGVAHWAHIGGFTTGMTIALAILFSRQFNTHGGDVLSVTLGKHAWPLIGKPGRWNIPIAPPVRAIVLPY